MGDTNTTLELIKIDKSLHSLFLSLRLQAAFIDNLLDIEPFKKGYRLGTGTGPILQEEPGLDIDELRVDSHNLQVIALGACVITLDETLNTLGPKNADSNDTIDKIRCVIFQMRNAYAHNPLDPEWQVKKENYLKVFNLDIEKLSFSLDMNEVNGQRLEADDFGGFAGFFKMVNYAKACLKDIE